MGKQSKAWRSPAPYASLGACTHWFFALTSCCTQYSVVLQPVQLNQKFQLPNKTQSFAWKFHFFLFSGYPSSNVASTYPIKPFFLCLSSGEAVSVANNSCWWYYTWMPNCTRENVKSCGLGSASKMIDLEFLRACILRNETWISWLSSSRIVGTEIFLLSWPCWLFNVAMSTNSATRKWILDTWISQHDSI